MSRHRCVPRWVAPLLVSFGPVALGGAILATVLPYPVHPVHVALVVLAYMLIVATAVAMAAVRDRRYHRAQAREE